MASDPNVTYQNGLYYNSAYPNLNGTLQIPLGGSVPSGVTQVGRSPNYGYYAPSGATTTAAAADPFSALLGGLMGGVPSASQSAEDLFKAYLQYGPQVAAQQYADLAKYAPLQTALGLDISGKFNPIMYKQQLQQLQQFLPQFQSVYQKALQQGQAADLQSLIALAPTLKAATLANQDPAVTQMWQTLLGQTQAELAAGQNMSPAQIQQAQQGIRAGQAARGTLNMNQGAAMEALNRVLSGTQLQTQRQNQAMNVMGQQAATQPDPYMAILGRPATALTAGSSTMSQGQTQPAMAGGSTASSIPALSGILNANAQNSSNYWNAANMAQTQKNQGNMLSVLMSQFQAQYPNKPMPVIV